MKVTIVILLTFFSSSFALKCKQCDSSSSTANIPSCTNPKEITCPGSTNVYSCYTIWKVDETTGVDTITEQGCGPKFSSDPTKTEHCELTDSSDFYTGGQCWCSGDKCNANKVSILETSDDRIKCYQCAKTSDACAKQDWDWKTLGSEITCPKGVRYCRIRQTGLQSFRRGCDSYLIDELNDDDLAFGLGGCTTSGSSETCACAQNKCNTGFHGAKCHDYVLSTCGNDQPNGGTVQCLTGVGSCGVLKVDYKAENDHDPFCTTYAYNCGFGSNSTGCDSDLNVPGTVDTAEICRCNAEDGDDLCDPTNSSSTLPLSFALIIAMLIFAFNH